MSPSDVEVLLHIYVVQEPHPRRLAPAVKKAIETFLREDLIYEAHRTDGEAIYKMTSRGDAHIRQIRNLNLPQQVWVGSDGIPIRGADFVPFFNSRGTMRYESN